MAFAYSGTGFTDPGAYDEDLAGAVKALDFVAQFSAILSIAGPSSLSDGDFEKKLAQACRFDNEIARRGRDRGVTVAVHPHSHHSSIVMNGEQYDRLLSATEVSGLMFTPDTGDIIRGGQDPLECFRRHRARIVHVHCKDVDADGKWQPMGKGICDFPGLFRFLEQTGYDGWVISEEESEAVLQDLAGAISRNRAYFRSQGL